MDDMPIELLQKVSTTAKAQVAAFGSQPAQDPLNALAYLALVFIDGVCDIALRERAAK